MSAPELQTDVEGHSLHAVVRSRSNYDPAPLAEKAGSGGVGGVFAQMLPGLESLGFPFGWPCGAIHIRVGYSGPMDWTFFFPVSSGGGGGVLVCDENRGTNEGKAPNAKLCDAREKTL